MDIYNQKGYSSRKEYLRSLADDYQVPFLSILSIAEMMGETEDFDGLIVMIEDHIVPEYEAMLEAS